MMSSPSEWADSARSARVGNEGTPRSIWPVRSNRDAQQQSLRITCGFPILGTITLTKPSRSLQRGFRRRSVPRLSQTMVSHIRIMPRTVRRKGLAALCQITVLRLIRAMPDCVWPESSPSDDFAEADCDVRIRHPTLSFYQASIKSFNCTGRKSAVQMCRSYATNDKQISCDLNPVGVPESCV